MWESSLKSTLFAGGNSQLGEQGVSFSGLPGGGKLKTQPEAKLNMPTCLDRCRNHIAQLESDDEPLSWPESQAYRKAGPKNRKLAR